MKHCTSTALLLFSFMCLKFGTPVCAGEQTDASSFRWVQYVAFSSLIYAPADNGYFRELIVDDIPKAKVNNWFTNGMLSYYRGRLFTNLEVGFVYGTQNPRMGELQTIMRRQYAAVRAGYAPLLRERWLVSGYTGLKFFNMKHKTDTDEGYGRWPEISRDPLHRVQFIQLLCPVGLQVTFKIIPEIYLQPFVEYLIPLGDPLLYEKDLRLDTSVDQPYHPFSAGIGLGFNFDTRW